MPKKEFNSSVDFQHNKLINPNLDREAIDGMGFVILRNDLPFANQLSQEKTIYEIRYDFDLENKTVTIPANSILKFEGGSLNNGALKGNNTSIIAGNYSIFGNINATGEWIGELNASWIGASSVSSFDNSTVLQLWLSVFSKCFSECYFPTDIYYFKSPCVLDSSISLRGLVLDGRNSKFYIEMSSEYAEDSVFLTVKPERFTLRNIYFENKNKFDLNGTLYNISKTRLLLYDSAQLFILSRVTIYNFDVAVTLRDVYYGEIDQSSIFHSRIGIYGEAKKASEINTVLIDNVRFSGITSISLLEAFTPRIDEESEEDYIQRYASVGIDLHCCSNGVKILGIVVEHYLYGVRFSWRGSQSRSNIVGSFNIDKCYFEDCKESHIYIGKGYIAEVENNYQYILWKGSITNCVFHVNPTYSIDLFLVDVSLENCKSQSQSPLLIKNNNIRNNFSTYGQNNIIVTNCYNTSVDDFNNPMLLTNNKNNSFWYTGKQANAYGILTNILGAVSNVCYKSQKLFGRLLKNGNLNVTTAINYDNSKPRYCNNNTSILPYLRIEDIVSPYSCEWIENQLYVNILSGNQYIRVTGNNDVILRLVTFADSMYSFRQLFYDWENNVSRKITALHYFSNKIELSQSEGLIYSIDDNNNRLGISGFSSLGLNASFTENESYFCVDTLCSYKYLNGFLVFESDIKLCGRDYSEFSISNEQKRLVFESLEFLPVNPYQNEIHFVINEDKYYIYNGFEWVELSSRTQRFNNYKSLGRKIERISMPDVLGQTFTNSITGITYSFVNGKWVGSLGLISDVDDNLVLQELDVNDNVCCNGIIYKYNGKILERYW